MEPGVLRRPRFTGTRAILRWTVSQESKQASVGLPGEVNSALETAAAHWSAQAVEGRLGKNWWEYAAIVRYVNRLICGRPLDGFMAGDLAQLSALLPVGTANRAVSVGCGLASKELVLLRNGVVGHFDLYEISEARIEQATAAAKKAGVEDRIAWHHGPADFESNARTTYDLVYWNNSLHHMLDTHLALRWSREALGTTGLLYMNDFVGPDRMQWPDEMLEVATEVRKALPARLLEQPEPLPSVVTRPDLEALIAMDPTECADSAAILPSIFSLFPDASVRYTGGVVYHLALKGILERLTPEDEGWLNLLLLVDEQYAKSGLTHYAVAHARPRPGRAARLRSLVRLHGSGRAAVT